MPHTADSEELLSDFPVFFFFEALEVTPIGFCSRSRTHMQLGFSSADASSRIDANIPGERDQLPSVRRRDGHRIVHAQRGL